MASSRLPFGTDRRVATLALARTADAFGNSFLIVVLPLFVAGPIDLDASLGVPLSLVDSLTEALAIGIALSGFSFASSLAQPLVGLLSDRTGRRRAFVLGGLAVLAAANAAYVPVESYAAVVGLRVLGGVGAALTIPPTVALIDRIAPEARGENLGVFNAARLLGFGVGPVVAGVIVSVDRYAIGGVTVSGFDVAFSLAALAAVVGFTLVAAFVPEPDPAVGSPATADSATADTVATADTSDTTTGTADTGGTGADSDVSSTTGVTAAIADLLLSITVRDPDGGIDPVLAVGLASLCIALVLATFAPLENAINARLDQGGAVFALQFAAGVLATIVLQAPIGRASDRYGRRPFLLAGFALLVPATLAQGFVRISVTMLLARFAQGVAVTLVYTPALALAGDRAAAEAAEVGSRSERTAGRLATVTTAYGLGVAIGPIVAGALLAYGFVVPFVVGAGLGVCGFCLVYVGVEEIEEIEGIENRS